MSKLSRFTQQSDIVIQHSLRPQQRSFRNLSLLSQGAKGVKATIQPLKDNASPADLNESLSLSKPSFGRVISVTTPISQTESRAQEDQRPTQQKRTLPIVQKTDFTREQQREHQKEVEKSEELPLEIRFSEEKHAQKSRTEKDRWIFPFPKTDVGPFYIGKKLQQYTHPVDAPAEIHSSSMEIISPTKNLHVFPTLVNEVILGDIPLGQDNQDRQETYFKENPLQRERMELSTSSIDFSEMLKKWDSKSKESGLPFSTRQLRKGNPSTGAPQFTQLAQLELLKRPKQVEQVEQAAPIRLPDQPVAALDPITGLHSTQPIFSFENQEKQSQIIRNFDDFGNISTIAFAGDFSDSNWSDFLTQTQNQDELKNGDAKRIIEVKEPRTDHPGQEGEIEESLEHLEFRRMQLMKKFQRLLANIRKSPSHTPQEEETENETENKTESTTKNEA